EDQDWRLDLGQAQCPQDLVARHVREIQVQKDDVVVVELAEIDAFFAQIGRIDVEALGLEHQFDALCRCTIVFNEQNAHNVPFPAAKPGCGEPLASSCDLLNRRLPCNG